MTNSHSAKLIGLTIIAFSLFLGLTLLTPQTSQSRNIGLERVVLPATLQILMSGGDKHLAANFETIRVSATWDGISDIDSRFRLRAHQEIATLNPCHEDNYYQANALLTWSGAPISGNEILNKAMKCRTWDDFPAFFYGFNHHYFFNNNIEAEKALAIATSRAPHKRSYRKLAILIAASNKPNDEAALAFLNEQKNLSSDAQLNSMLERSIIRLQGLITLKTAQKKFEAKYKKNLNDPTELITTGIIESFPIDPTRLGYEFEKNQFKLATLKVN